MHEYNIRLSDQKEIAQYGKERGYDAVVIAVAHNEYRNLDENYFLPIVADNSVLVDIKGIYKGKINQMRYWSL